MDFLELMEREFTGDERKAAAKSGEAMPDGSFPIKNEEDLHNAVQAVGRANDPAKAKAHIKARAKALGCEGCLPDGWKESTRALFANVEQLEESATYQPSTGNLTVTVIKPGVSKNNRYYSPELLKSRANIFEGAKMFADHQTDKDAAARPEGSVKDWVGTINSVKCEADGTVKATVNIHNEAFKTNLKNLKAAGNLNQMGVSIRAYGESSDGEVAGKKCKVIESLLGCKSVDFVTYAGAGGQVESMSESVDPDDVMLMDVDTLRAKRPDLVAALQPVKETRRNVKKNNGASGNFAEGSPFNVERNVTTTNNDTPHDPFAKGDRLLLEADVKRGIITTDQVRVLNGQLTEAGEAEYGSLTEGQKAEFNFAKMCGISEADAFKLVKITGGYNNPEGRGGRQ